MMYIYDEDGSDCSAAYNQYSIVVCVIGKVRKRYYPID